MCCRVHPSAVEAVSSMISESAGTEFLLIISEPIGTVRQPWKQFPRRFLSRQRLSFC